MTVYRTTGAWGPGKGSNLTAAEVDGNFYDHDQRIEDLETSRPQPDDFASVSTSGNLLTFHLQSGTTLGPVTMPTLQWQDRGAWLPFTLYAALDVVSVSGQGLFLVQVSHTSAATFDPNLSAGSPPAAVYQLLIGADSNTQIGDLADVDVTGAAANAMLVAVSSGSPATITWEGRTPAQVTALLDTFSGDAGAGGAKGLVPAPAAGDAAADKYLSASGNWTNPAIGDIGGLGANVATFLGTPSAANFAAAITGETGSGAPVFGTGPTIDAVILTGNTTLPGSGQISSAGDLGIGGAPTARFSTLGTYATANQSLVRIAGTLNSSATSSQRPLTVDTILNPSGASLTSVYGIASVPAISGAASINVTAYSGVISQILINSGYSGTITNASAFRAFDPANSGNNPFTNYAGFHTNTITHGNGLTTGAVTNNAVQVDGITSGAAGGTLHNRGILIILPSGGASSGTTNNRGIYINGNGGTASGGTVNNHAIYSDSTARIYLAGQVSIGTTTDPGAGNLLVSGTGKFGAYTVATLPAAGTAGRRAYVTDSNAAITAGIGAIVAGGGANIVPVFDDGTNWRIV